MKGTIWGAWNRDVVVITTVQLKSTKPELRFSQIQTSPRGVSDIRDSEDLRQLTRLEIRLNVFCNTKATHHHLTIRANNRINDYEISLWNLLAKDGSFTVHDTNIQI